MLGINRGGGENVMISVHDNLEVLSTEEILKKNVYDLQEQLTEAYKKIASLQEKLEQKGEKYVISI
jgi:tRNA(Phe) wybutosine-synthesizing methylase Tyw3